MAVLDRRVVRRAPLVVLAAVSVLLPLTGPAEAVLTTTTNEPPKDATILVQRDSSHTTYAGKQEETSDTSSAPVDVAVTFP